MSMLSKKEEIALTIIVGIFVLTLSAHLAYTIWQDAWINCPTGCPNKVKRKNQDRDLRPCPKCKINIWTCMTTHKRVCQVKGCKVDNGYYWVCPTRPDGVDFSTEHLHHNGICAIRPRFSSIHPREQ